MGGRTQNRAEQGGQGRITMISITMQCRIIILPSSFYVNKCVECVNIAPGRIKTDERRTGRVGSRSRVSGGRRLCLMCTNL